MIKFVFAIVFFVGISWVFGAQEHCSAKLQKLVKPCKCQPLGCQVSCESGAAINLTQVFDNLTTGLNKDEKHLDCFFMNNTNVSEFGDNVFRDILFDIIDIDGAKNLSKIHPNAFNQTGNFTKIISIFNTPVSNASALFAALTRLTNVSSIMLVNNNFTEVPDNAFRTLNGTQKNLWQLVIGGKAIKRIGDYAFSALNNIQIIEVANTSVTNISEKAFAFNSTSNTSLTIDLVSNPLNSSSFAAHAFDHLNRPTHIQVLSLDERNVLNNITYLNETVFRPFLALNDHNIIDLKADQLNCSDARNSWLTNNVTLSNRIGNNRCH